MTFHSIIQLLLICLPVSLLYDVSKCPMPWEWGLRGKGYCNSSKDYSCLFNEITNKSEESCRFKAHELKLGEQYVLQLIPEGELCTNKAKYQPFKLNRLQTECSFVRSKCKEPGQVVFHRGNASKDTTCRCNFKDGWSYVTRPKALCFCVSSEEDCSCHLKICPSSYVLTPDYQCVKKLKLNYMSFSCPDMNPQRNNSHGNTLSRIKLIIDEPIPGQSHSFLLIVSTSTFIGCILFIVIVGFLTVLEKLPSFCYYQISHPTNLTYDTETGSMILTWTKPPLKQRYIDSYKVEYTLNEWKDLKTSWSDRNESSCKIADILPLKTYRITIRSCLKNSFEGECSDEIIYISPGPNRPQTLHVVGIHGNITLMWTAPVASVLRIDAYHLEVTNNQKNSKETTIKLSSDNLEYLIKNAVEGITYRFKIYSISKEIRSPATEESFYTGPCQQITLPIEASEDEQDLNNVNSVTYRNNVNALEAGVREEYKTVEGEQTVLNPKFWNGSFFASFILVSKGFYDQKMLQTIMEQAVNKGIFGGLKVSKDGFIIKALNYPVPPKHITTEIYDRNVKVSWLEPAKTFFKPEGFIIQYTTDKWETCKDNFVPEDEHQFIINVASPSVILQVKIYTYIKSSIRSLPSEEVYVDLCASKLDNLIVTTRQTMDTQHKAMRTLFVETRAFREILQTLKSKNFVIINGNPGDGKTTLAYHAMHFLTTRGKRPLEINMQSQHDWNIFTKSSKENLVILIDNVFGEYSVSSERVSQWSHQSRVLQDALSHDERNNYLIITIRSEIYRQCGENITSDTFFNSAIVHISQGSKYGLNDEEMKSIFQKYVPAGCNPKRMPIPSINVRKLGFQQCCRLFKEIPKLRDMGIRFFENPLSSLNTEITKGLNNGDMDMAILVSILLYGGTVKKCTINSICDKELKLAAMKMCCVHDQNLDLFSERIANFKSPFVVHTKEFGKECIKFSHSSIQSTVLFVTGKHRPEELIQNCHFTLLPMMTTSQCSNIEIENLQIPDNCITVLCYRVRELLSARSLSSGLLQVLSDLSFWKDNRFFEEFVSCDHLLIKPRDETGLSMFVHFSAVGCVNLVKHLYKRIVETDDLKLALKAACGSNKLEIIDFLLQNNVIPDIECSFNAVKGGHMQTINKLVTAGVDLTQVCKSQTVWDTTTSVLEEAALQNQCHLIEPLLQCCKQLINIKSSIGASAIHFVASAGDVGLLKKLIDDDKFDPYDISDIGSTILHFASQNNRFEAVKYIIENYPYLMHEKYYCFAEGTILHTAAQSGNCDLFKYIFDHIGNFFKSIELDAIQLGRNCHILIDDRKTEMVDKSMLLHVRDINGISIMHRAAWSRSVQIVQFLLDNGIEVVGSIYENNSSVIDFAKTRNDNNNMIEFLQKHISNTKTSSLLD